MLGLLALLALPSPAPPAAASPAPVGPLPLPPGVHGSRQTAPSGHADPARGGAAPGLRRDLSGLVVLGPDSSGAAGVPVELHRITTEAGAVVDTTVSGPGGGFTFSFQEPAGSEAVYLAGARYGGVRYFGAPLHGGAAPPGAYVIAVYDTAVAAGSEPPALAMRHTILSATGPPGSSLDVMEIFDLEGDPRRTLVPAGPGVPVWSSSLPEGAREAQALPAGSAGGEAAVEAERVTLTGSLPPAGRRVAVRYLLPGGGTLRLPVEHATRRLELLIAPGAAGARVEGLEEAAPAEVEGRTYLRFRGSELEPGSRVVIELADGRGAAAWVWLCAGLLLLVAAALARRLMGDGAAPHRTGRSRLPRSPRGG